MLCNKIFNYEISRQHLYFSLSLLHSIKPFPFKKGSCLPFSYLLKNTSLFSKSETAKDYWHKYDSNNRIILAKGELTPNDGSASTITATLNQGRIFAIVRSAIKSFNFLKKLKRWSFSLAMAFSSSLN